jgi:endonuclease/exonuclease/phosphatase family metal-dependent hydrolase
MILKLLTYNIHGLPWCGADIKSIAHWMITESGADIVCIQESFSLKQRRVFERECELYNWSSHFPNDYCWLGSCLRGLECGSGLAIFTNPKIQVHKIPVFQPFYISGGVDSLVKKGIFIIECEIGSHKYTIINTHQQSDFTDIPGIRINYPEIRESQQFQLYAAASKHENVCVVGDMNMQTFKWFDRPDQAHHITFPETGEHLDHLLTLRKEAKKVKYVKTEYFDDAPWSDHIPVLFSVSLE